MVANCHDLISTNNNLFTSFHSCNWIRRLTTLDFVLIVEAYEMCKIAMLDGKFPKILPGSSTIVCINVFDPNL